MTFTRKQLNVIRAALVVAGEQYRKDELDAAKVRANNHPAYQRIEDAFRQQAEDCEALVDLIEE